MLRKGCLIALIVLLLVGLATCGSVCLINQLKGPPSSEAAPYEVEVWRGDIMLNYYLAEELTINPPVYILNGFYETVDGSRWIYHKSPSLPITEGVSGIKVRWYRRK